MSWWGGGNGTGGGVGGSRTDVGSRDVRECTPARVGMYVLNAFVDQGEHIVHRIMWVAIAGACHFRGVGVIVAVMAFEVNSALINKCIKYIHANPCRCALSYIS